MLCSVTESSPYPSPCGVDLPSHTPLAPIFPSRIHTPANGEMLYCLSTSTGTQDSLYFVFSCNKVKTVTCDSWGISKYTPFGVHFTVQFSLQSQSLPNRLVGVSVAIKNACCADKGPTSTRSCPDSGIAIATPDTPTTFTCSRYKGALGRSLCRIADFVALVSQKSPRKGICHP